jgi:hypothetical protein
MTKPHTGKLIARRTRTSLITTLFRYICACPPFLQLLQEARLTLCDLDSFAIVTLCATHFTMTSRTAFLTRVQGKLQQRGQWLHVLTIMHHGRVAVRKARASYQRVSMQCVIL